MDLWADLDEGLAALKDIGPTIMTDVPEAAPLAPFLPLLAKAMEAIGIIQTATGASLPDAVAQVAQHLTPGQPDSSVLNANAAATAPAADTTGQIAAIAAATAAPTPDATQTAVAAALPA